MRNWLKDVVNWSLAMLSPVCEDCGEPKPKFTHYCDRCWEYIRKEQYLP